VRTLDVGEALLCQEWAGLPDVLCEPWSDLESEFTGHDQSTDYGEFRKWAVITIELKRSGQDAVEELIVTGEERSCSTAGRPQLDGDSLKVESSGGWQLSEACLDHAIVLERPCIADRPEVKLQRTSLQLQATKPRSTAEMRLEALLKIGNRSTRHHYIDVSRSPSSSLEQSGCQQGSQRPPEQNRLQA
jgi:hypothetical protein